MHIQGKPIAKEFIEVPRPKEVSGGENRLTREMANKAFSDVLYEGAKIKRNM